jgi:hypothetical protein
MNIRPLIKRLLVLGAMLSWLPLPACGGLPVYSAAPIEGWVVDADTNQPLEEVIVTANWQLVSGTLAGGEIPKGQLMVMESVTDKNGRFHFEGWTKVNPTTGELRNKDPQILMFKPGYRYRVFTNDYPVDQVVIGFKRESKLNGQTVKLERFKGDLRVYGRHFQLDTDLENVLRDCEWKRIPRMIVALDLERKRIKAADPAAIVGVPSIGYLDAFSSRCGSAEEFFGRKATQ